MFNRLFFRTLMFIVCSLCLAASVLAQDSGGTQPEVTTSGLLVMCVELIAMVVVGMILAWPTFSLLWHSTGDPFLSVRISYLITIAALLCYVGWRFYPIYLQDRIGGPSYLRWVIIGVILLVSTLILFLNRGHMPETESSDTQAT